ncbi:unnamed protein product [Ectocarpus sp. 13 AM-2016]
MLGADHPLVAVALNSIAGLVAAQGRPQEAQSLYQHAFNILEVALGRKHPDLATVLFNWALVLETQGKYKEAGLLYERFPDISEKALGPDHPAVAMALKSQERYEEAAVGQAAKRGSKVNPALKGLESSLRDHREPKLVEAARGGNFKLVENFLVSGRFRPDVQSFGMTPLHYAVQNGHKEIVKLLLRHAADPNRQNTSGLSALHMASASTSHEMVTILLDWGADPCIRSKNGLRPSRFAACDEELEKRLENAAKASGIASTQILAPSLGCEAEVFQSATFGVELQLQDGSLDAKVRESVTISPEVLVVQCSNERDTSRTHGGLEARAWDDPTTKPSAKAFLAMPIVDGPSSVKFNEEKPAKLRFFVGFLDELTAVDEEQEGGVAEVDNLEARLRRKYELLVSPDGVFWIMQRRFEVEQRSHRGLRTEIWLETEIYHFSRGALAEVHPNYDPANMAACLQDDIYIEAKVPTRLYGLRPKIPNFNKHKHVLLGNATSTNEVYFYCINNGHNINHKRVRGISVGPPVVGEFGGKMEDHNAMAPTGVGTIRRLRLDRGRYAIEPTFNDLGYIHPSITVAVVYTETLVATPSPGGTPAAAAPVRKYFLLGTRPLDLNNMLIVTDRWVQEWRDRRWDFKELPSSHVDVVLAEVSFPLGLGGTASNP